MIHFIEFTLWFLLIFAVLCGFVAVVNILVDFVAMMKK